MTYTFHPERWKFGDLCDQARQKFAADVHLVNVRPADWEPGTVACRVTVEGRNIRVIIEDIDEASAIRRAMAALEANG
jgi:hypothetical protein